MKKLIVIGVVVFAFALTMNVAFATSCDSCNEGPSSCFCPTTTVINANGALTTSNISSYSGTGDNGVHGVFGTANISSGATSAMSVAETRANNNNLSVTTSPFGRLTVFNANLAGTTNNVNAVAETGNNHIGCAGSSAISTGSATTAASALTVVNTNVVQVNRCCALGCGSVCVD